MGKAYWESEITKLMNDEISSRVDRLLRGDESIASDVKAIERLRHYREFADEITAQLIRADMDDEARLKRLKAEMEALTEERMKAEAEALAKEADADGTDS